MRTEKISEYLAHYIIKHGYPRTTEDLRAVLRTASQAVLVDAFDRFAADRWLAQEVTEQLDPQRQQDGHHVGDARGRHHSETTPEAQRVAVKAAITAIDAVIDACDDETIDATLDNFATYIHARHDMIRAQRALLGDAAREDHDAYGAT